MSRTIAAAALLLACASAQSPRCDVSGASGRGWGPGVFDTRNNTTNTSAQVIFDRTRKANSTSSINFNFTVFGSAPEQWTWRVNITNVRIGDLNQSGSIAGAGFHSELEDPHVVNAAYDFQWSGGGDINATIARFGNDSYIGSSSLGAHQLCAATFNLQGLPYDISNKYQESDNGDCSNVLGEECVEAMLKQSWSTTNRQCGLPSKGFAELPECKSIFDVPGRSCGASSHDLGNSTYSAPIQYPGGELRPLRSGESWYYHSDGATNGTNLTRLYNANQELRVIVLSGVPGTRQMLCQKVDKSDARTSEAEDAFNSTSLEEGAASSVSPTRASRLSMLALVALYSML